MQTRHANPDAVLQQTSARRGLRSLVMGLAVAALASGCAVVTVGDDGRRHVLGLVWLELPAADMPVGADQLRLRSVGLTLGHGPLGSSIAVGYSDQTIARIRNDAWVRLDADHPPRPTPEQPQEP